MKNKKGKQKKANCLSWNEWRKVRKKKVSPTKSPCDHFETRTKDDMGLSWFWFGVVLVCGLVPPLFFLLFWGSHSAPWPATKTGPLGLPGSRLYWGSNHGRRVVVAALVQALCRADEWCCCYSTWFLDVGLDCKTWLTFGSPKEVFLTLKRKLLSLKLLVFVETEGSKNLEKGGNDV